MNLEHWAHRLKHHTWSKNSENTDLIRLVLRIKLDVPYKPFSIVPGTQKAYIKVDESFLWTSNFYPSIRNQMISLKNTKLLAMLWESGMYVDLITKSLNFCFSRKVTGRGTEHLDILLVFVFNHTLHCCPNLIKPLTPQRRDDVHYMSMATCAFFYYC